MGLHSVLSNIKSEFAVLLLAFLAFFAVPVISHAQEEADYTQAASIENTGELVQELQVSEDGTFEGDSSFVTR